MNSDNDKDTSVHFDTHVKCVVDIFEAIKSLCDSYLFSDFFFHSVTAQHIGV